jgi:DnaK suppressor protein
MEPARAEDLLREARARTEAEFARVDQRPTDDEPGDTGDAGTDLVARETDAALAESLSERLAAIGRAEARLREGTYGRSVISGEPIPDARLEIEPWAETTVAEAEGRR